MFRFLHPLLHPVRCYVLCSVARSGAHLLSGGLRATRMAGRPEQYFHRELCHEYAERFGLDAANDFTAYVQGIKKATATPNSVFAFRIESWEVDNLIKRLRNDRKFGAAEATDREVLETAFPRLRYIQLTRQDKVRQAISKARALQTNQWVAGREQKAAGTATYDAKLIGECLRSSQRAEELWEDFFRRNKIMPLRVTYEEVCADYAATVERVLKFLRLRPPHRFRVGEPTTQRQADATTEEWVERWRRETGGA